MVNKKFMKRILPVRCFDYTQDKLRFSVVGLAVILGSSFVGLMPAMEVAKKAFDSISETDWKTNLCMLAKPLGSYALKYSMSYSHELGHALVNKFLLGNPSKIYVSPLLLRAYTDSTEFSDKFLNLTPESRNKRLAIYYLAGPLLGLAVNVLVLQSHNILIEYCRDTSGDLLQVCLKGLQKPLFNLDQSLWISIPVLWDITANINSLINVEGNTTDISRALKRLQINNPKDSHPRISKFINYLIPMPALITAGLVIGCKMPKFLNKK
jgi:hypothetical protein